MDTPSVPTDWQHISAEDLALMYRSMLFGGEPGSGKSALAAVLAAHAALTDPDGDVGPEVGGFGTGASV